MKFSLYKFTVQRRNVWQVFALYVIALFYVVFLTPNRYKDYDFRANLVPVVATAFRITNPTHQPAISYYIEYWGNIFGNLLLFAPMGFLLVYLYPFKRAQTLVLYATGISVFIELVQGLLKIGVCDIDDVLLNALGAMMGIFLFNKWFAVRLRNVVSVQGSHSQQL